MRELWTDIQKIRDELRIFVQVNTAKPRPTRMLMHMDVEHRNPVLIRKLQRIAYRTCAHHCPHAWVVQVIFVLYRLVTFAEHDNAISNGRDAAMNEADAFRCIRMRSCEVCTYSIH